MDKETRTVLKSAVHEYAEKALDDGMNLRNILLRVKRHVVATAIRREGGNHVAAARSLGVHRNTLTRLTGQCGIDGRMIRQQIRSARKEV